MVGAWTKLPEVARKYRPKLWGTKDNAVMENWWTQNSLEDPKDLMMAFCSSFHPLQF